MLLPAYKSGKNFLNLKKKKKIMAQLKSIMSSTIKKRRKILNYKRYIWLQQEKKKHLLKIYWLKLKKDSTFSNHHSQRKEWQVELLTYNTTKYKCNKTITPYQIQMIFKIRKIFKIQKMSKINSFSEWRKMPSICLSTDNHWQHITY